jgi:hypothetical protein
VAFLDWIRPGRSKAREQEPEGERLESPHHTTKGNTITPQIRGDWQSGDDGLHEFRHHIGKSIEGFHGGLEVSFRGGEHSFSWSNKRPTARAAERASFGMQQAWELGDQRSEQSIRNNQKLRAEWEQDHTMAKQRNETGREPECRPLNATEASESVVKNARPRRSRLNDHDIRF